MSSYKLKSAAGLDAVVLPVSLPSVDIHACATAVMTDFTRQIPAQIPVLTSADETIRWMDNEKFRWQLVVGLHQEIRGLLVKGSANEQKLMQWVAAGRDRAQLSAGDLMVPLSGMYTVTYQQLVEMDVADLIKSLRESRAQYCLVLQGDEHHIRGLLCAQEVAERLGLELKTLHSPTFIDIFHAVHG